MSSKTMAFVTPFSSLRFVLCALHLLHSMALRSSPDWIVASRSSVLQSQSNSGTPGPRCSFMPRGTQKKYYFDLPSADPSRPEDDRAVVLLRDPQDPKLVVYKHAHWKISQKTKDAKLVGLPQWTPVDSSTKIQQEKIVIDIYKQIDFARQSKQDGIVKFELAHTACSDDQEAKEKVAQSDSPSSAVSSGKKICGVEFAGGTYYPAELVKAALSKIGGVWKDKEQISLNSSKTFDVDFEPANVKKWKKLKRYGKIGLFAALAPIPAFVFAGEAAPILVDLIWPSVSLIGFASWREKYFKKKYSPVPSAAEKLFEKIYCLSGVCTDAKRKCMAKCVDAENEENHVAMPRNKIVYATKFRCK